MQHCKKHEDTLKLELADTFIDFIYDVLCYTYVKHLGEHVFRHVDRDKCFTRDLLVAHHKEINIFLLEDKINLLLKDKRYIVSKIASRAKEIQLFNNPAILFVYYLAVECPNSLVSKWPFSEHRAAVLETILSDLDI